MDPQQAKSIFLHAVEHIAPDQWPNYLSVACSGNPSLRHEVEVLLSAHQDDGDLAEQARQACADALPTVDQPITEKPGTQIGPYKLLQQLGEGGMGVVYMAEQKEPVKRRVALKIIKPGMDTRQVIARFEAERQALAMMDHPNIAKVLDAGATESGRPYFVMELVNGLPVTKYCDEQHLTPKERLELFVPICQAVQHAHQKGIIHRDLKPSNILVALYDGQAVPKIIDFGVAKATSQTLTEKTMFTQLGQVVGTFEYMSPEQAERNQLDIDTRSDIYSLGVVLYELLTGETPLDRQRLRAAAFDEMLRMIRDEEPVRPSTRLSSSQSLPAIAANRRSEPEKLGSLIRGEIDWIVMKALEKDRSRRYETASGFAADLRRHLDGEAVVACPASAMYRFRKFARRHRSAIIVSGIVLTLLVAGLLGTSWQAIRAMRAEKRYRHAAMQAARERDIALQAEQRAEVERQGARSALRFLSGALEQAAPYRQPDKNLRVSAFLDQAAARLDREQQMPPAVETAIRQVLGRIYWSLGEFATAEVHLTRAYALHRNHLDQSPSETLKIAYDLAMLYWMQGDFAKAEPLLVEVSEQQADQSDVAPSELLQAKNVLALIYLFRDEADRAERLFNDALRISVKLDEDRSPSSLTVVLRRGIGLACLLQGRYEEAEKCLSDVLQQHSQRLGENNPETLVTKAMLASAQLSLGRLETAARLAEETLQARTAVFGETNPHTLSSQGMLARARLAQGRSSDAEPHWRLLLQQAEAQRDRLPPFTIRELADVGSALLEEANFPEAERCFRLCLELAVDTSPDSWRIAWLENGLGAAIAGQRRLAEAESHLRRGRDGLLRQQSQIPQALRGEYLAKASERLARIHQAWNQQADPHPPHR